MQLVAYGAQDVYLTANPQVTFFKQLYRRHSNFAMESIEQTFNGVASFGKKVTCTIARNGDLISRVYLQATLPAVSSLPLLISITEEENPDDPEGPPLQIVESGSFKWIEYIGQYLIKSVEVEIGGQLIDKHYGDWLHVWNELTLPPGKTRGYLNMVNGYGGITLEYRLNDSGCPTGCTTLEEGCRPSTYNSNIAARGTDAILCGAIEPFSSTNNCLPEFTVSVPLEFWFNRHSGLALPLIALQYHEVKINIEFNDLQYLIQLSSDTPNRSTFLSNLNTQGLVNASLWVDYIYLDTEERRRFAQVAHEYLIEQLQFTGEESVTTASYKAKLDFNHPVKELIWTLQRDQVIDCNYMFNKPFDYTITNKLNPVRIAKLQLNGHDRFAEREGHYFNFTQPYQYHTSTPSTGINVYSFALRPEEHQPSGSCNFSRIDNAILNLTLDPQIYDVGTGRLRIYATSYNVLRIMSGMGGLAFSN